MKSMSKKQVKEIVDNRDLIEQRLIELERNWAWLSRKTGIHYATIYSCFVQRLFKVSDENLVLINEAIGTNFK